MKPILINGFPRSGTTYLFYYLRYKNDKSLDEPITAIDNFYRHIKTFDCLKDKLLEHPKIGDPIYIHFNFFMDSDKTIKFIRILSDCKFNVKETTLHLYLDRISDYYDIYFIIRHPGDVFLSFLKRWSYYKQHYLIYKFLKTFWPIYKTIYKVYPTDFHFNSKKILELKRPRLYGKNGFLEDFIIVYTFVNWYAINHVSEKNIIIYENKETFYKLPNFEEYEKNNPIRIVKYKKREKYTKIFREITRSYDLYSEFKEIMSFFDS